MNIFCLLKFTALIKYSVHLTKDHFIKFSLLDKFWRLTGEILFTIYSQTPAFAWHFISLLGVNEVI